MRHTIKRKLIIIRRINIKKKKIIMNFLSIEALQLTTQGKNCMSRGHFRPRSVIHILVRNKLIVHVDFLEEEDKKIIIVKSVPHVQNAYFSRLLVDTKAP